MWAPFAINTVYALLEGARQALNELCPSTEWHGVLCDSYRQNTSILVQKIKEVRLDLYSIQNKQKIFDSKGDGDIGYQIFNVIGMTGDEMEYSRSVIGVIIVIDFEKRTAITLYFQNCDIIRYIYFNIIIIGNIGRPLDFKPHSERLQNWVSDMKVCVW